jgi:hypothetical protein
VKRYIVTALLLLAAASGAAGQAITLRLRPVSQADRNFRVGGMAGFTGDDLWRVL